MWNCAVMVFMVFVVGVGAQCKEVDWSVTFEREGLSKCDKLDLISGFYRSKPSFPFDKIGHLEKVQCCSKPAKWAEVREYVIESWWRSLVDDFTWSQCQPGYFLTGLYRTGNDSILANIKEGRCVKSHRHPEAYGRCTDVDMSDCFKKEGWCRCPDGLFVVGVFNERCQELSCLVKMRCCTFVN